MNKKLVEKLLFMLLDEEDKQEQTTWEVCQKELEPKEMIGERVITRWYYSWVHFGKLLSDTEQWLILESSRRIYYWKGAFTLSEIANNGVADWSKLTESVAKIMIKEKVSEIIPCTKKAIKNLKNFSIYTI